MFLKKKEIVFTISIYQLVIILQYHNKEKNVVHFLPKRDNLTCGIMPLLLKIFVWLLVMGNFQAHLNPSKVFLHIAICLLMFTIKGGI